MHGLSNIKYVIDYLVVVTLFLLCMCSNKLVVNGAPKNPGIGKRFFFSRTFLPTLRPTQHPLQRALLFSPGTKRAAV
jgi:hypothetical protein